MPRAAARHILVATEQKALEIKLQIEGGSAFDELAKKHSSCPSGKQGGSLGTFNKGDMVPEFDRVVFGDLAINAVSEPIKTQFGWHLIQVQQRLA